MEEKDQDSGLVRRGCGNNEGNPLPTTHNKKGRAKGAAFSGHRPALATPPEIFGQWPTKSGPDCQELM
jgi:hypothetical protein